MYNVAYFLLSFYLLPDVPVDLINNPESIFNPIACKSLILGNPKITGTNQFHSHIIGNPSKIDIISKSINPKIAIPTISKILFILFSFIFNY